MLRPLAVGFMVLVIFEGALRKWILPAYPTAVFVLKDAILMLAVVAYAMQRQRNEPTTGDLAPWLLWAGLAVTYAAISGFSFVSVVGLRYYLAPLPLIFLVPALLRDANDLDRMAVWAVRLSVPIGVLGLIQYLSPVDSPINSYAWGGEEDVSTFGVEEEGLLSGQARPRITATFSYIGMYAAFLSVVWLLAWLSLLHAHSRWDRWFAGVALVIIVFNMAMNGSRSLLVFAILSGLPFLVLLMRRLGILAGVFLLAGMAVAVGYLEASIFEPFMLTAARGGEEEGTSRISGALLMPFATLSDVGFVGMGIGSTFAGFERLGGQGVLEGFDEVNLDRIGIELGVVGYAIMVLLKIMMLIKTVLIYRGAPLDSLRHWALAALVLQISTVWQIPFYNSVAAISYFSAIGLVFWLGGESKRLVAASRGAGSVHQHGEMFAWRGWR